MVVAVGGVVKFKDRWTARYKEDGIRKQVYGLTPEEALIKRQELIDKLNKPFSDDTLEKDETVDSKTIENADENDVFPEDNDVTLGKWLTDWLETSIKPNKSTSTYKGYKIFVTKHIIPSMGDVKLADITPDLMQVFLNAKVSQSSRQEVGEVGSRSRGKMNGTNGGMSPQSISNMQFMLKSALEIAVNNKLISYNPMDLVSVTRVARKEKRVLTHEEEKTLIEACNSSEKIILYGVVIALRLGLDIGEVLALKWTDIDHDYNQVCVRRTIKRETVGDVSADKKTALLLVETDSIRIIQKQAIQGEFIIDMKALKDKYISSIGLIPETVIANSNGLPVDPSYYSRLYKKILESTGILNANFDILKNTFVVRLFEKGLNSSDIQRIMGYSEASRPIKRLKDIAFNEVIKEQLDSDLLQ